jgi:hypothetical protein
MTWLSSYQKFREKGAIIVLDHFPRPPGDNGRGVHWSHSPYFWGKDNWSFWKEQILAMNLKWVKLLDDGGGSAEGLVKRLIDIKVMPVVRFYKEAPNPGHITAREAATARRYAAMGAVYFETNNEPDLALEWKDRRRPDNWLDIVVNNFIIEADMIREAGGYLLFPAFGPGGRGNPFQLIVQKGRRDILDGNCGLAIHNYCLGRPLDYPNDAINTTGQPLSQAEWEAQGGLWAWEMGYETVKAHRRQMANPDASIMTDSTCFRAFEYFDALVNQAAGHSIPIFTTEGGYNVGQRAGTTFGDDPRYPKPTPERAAQLTDDMFRYIETGPQYYFACMPWLIAVSRMGIWGDAFENQGPWFTHHFDKQFGLKGELPVVAKLKARPGRLRQAGPVPPGMANFYTGPDLSGREFDDRLKYLKPQVKLVPVADPSQPHWRLSKVRWADEKESQGRGYIFVTALDEQGRPLEGLTFLGDRGNAVDRVATKGAIDQYLGNYLMTGTVGTYTVSVAYNNLPSDKLINVGLGNEVNPNQPVPTAFYLTFQKVLGQPGREVSPAPEPPPPPKPAPVPPPAPKPDPGLPLPARSLDPRLAQLKPPVRLEEVAEPSRPHWRLVNARWADQKEAQGRTYIFVTALDESGKALENVKFLVDRGNVVDEVATKGPIDQYMGNYLMTAGLGTYRVSMGQGRLPSDVLTNVGIGDGVSSIRTSFYLTFQRSAGQPVPPPPVPPPPDPVKEKAALAAALRQAAGQHLIPLDRQAALYQYAQTQRLGQFLSAEFSLTWAGIDYRAQLFEKGLVYLDPADPQSISHFTLEDKS